MGCVIFISPINRNYKNWRVGMFLFPQLE